MARWKRRETLGKVQEIAKALREMKNVQQFDEEMHKMLIEADKRAKSGAGGIRIAGRDWSYRDFMNLRILGE